MYKEDLALNNLHELKCIKPTKPNQTVDTHSCMHSFITMGI